MDIHILKEKIDRSYRLLSRLRDEFGRILDVQLQIMGESQNYLDALIKVKDSLDSQINEKQAKSACNKCQLFKKGCGLMKCPNCGFEIPIEPKWIKKGVLKNDIKINYKKDDSVATRAAFGNALAKLGKINEAVIALDGDVKNSTMTQDFFKAFPKRSFDSFIAEQNLVGMAIGFSANCGSLFTKAYFTVCFSLLLKVPANVWMNSVYALKSPLGTCVRLHAI